MGIGSGGGDRDTGRYEITETKEGGKAEKAGLRVDDVVLTWQDEDAVNMLYDRFEGIMRNDPEIKVTVMRAGMQNVTTRRAWDKYNEE